MTDDKQLTVLVTGFGKFSSYEINPSWEAVKLLPELFRKSEKSSTVNLIIENIDVAYETVQSRVKELWEKHRPALMIHTGVSNLAQCLTIECQAHSKGYKRTDINGKIPDETDVEDEIIKTNCDVVKLCQVINECSNETSCLAEISDDVGRYLCEYIYYQSLSIREPLVLFVHVPTEDIYSYERSARGLLKILIHLIECAIGERCIKK